MSEPATVMPMMPPLGERKKYYIDWRNPPKEEDRHREIYMYVSLQDTVHWYCDKKFRVRSVDPARENPDAPYPFYRCFPADPPEEFAFQVNSGPARPEAGRGYLYKPVFEFEDGTPNYDPHIRTYQGPGGG